MTDKLARQHSIRFRRIGGNDYARRVTEAYNGDQAAAARDSDTEVAAKVAIWEIEQGLKPRNWTAIGIANERYELNWKPVMVEAPSWALQEEPIKPLQELATEEERARQIVWKATRDLRTHCEKLMCNVGRNRLHRREFKRTATRLDFVLAAIFDYETPIKKGPR